MSVSFRDTERGPPFQGSVPAGRKSSAPSTWSQFSQRSQAPHIEVRESTAAVSSGGQADVSSASYDAHSTIAGPSPNNWMAGQSLYDPPATSQAMFTASQYAYDASYAAGDAASAQQVATSEDLHAFLEYQKSVAAASQTAGFQSYQPASVTQASYQQPTTDIQTYTDFQQLQQQQQMSLLQSQQPQQQSNIMYNQLGQPAVQQPFPSPGQQPTFVNPGQQAMFANPAQQPAHITSMQQPMFVNPGQQQTLAVPAQQQQQQPFASLVQQQAYGNAVQQQAFLNPQPAVQHPAFGSPHPPVQQSVFGSPQHSIQQLAFGSPPPQRPVQQPAFVSPVQQPSVGPPMQQPQPTLASSSARPPFAHSTSQPFTGNSTQTTRMTQRDTNVSGQGALHARGHGMSNPRGPRPPPPWSDRPQYDRGPIIRTTVFQPSRVGQGHRAPMESRFGGNGMAGLTMEVNRYYREHMQSAEMLRKKNEVRMILEQAIQDRVSREFKVCLYGSSVNGFGSRNSDADFSVVTLGERHENFRGGKLRVLEHTLREFRKNPIRGGNVTFGKFFLVRAKVPLLRFKFWRVEADLSVDNIDGVKNSVLLQSFADVDVRVAPLVILIKDWSKYSGINNAPAGYLSSYSIVLMVIFFLQCCSPPIVPCFKAEYQQQENLNSLHYTDTEGLKSVLATSTFVRRNGADLGPLVRDFFRFYADFDFNCVISIRCGCKLTKTEKWFKDICIEEPFQRDNTARALQNFNVSLIKKRFAKALADLEKKPHVSTLVRLR